MRQPRQEKPKLKPKKAPTDTVALKRRLARDDSLYRDARSVHIESLNPRGNAAKAALEAFARGTARADTLARARRGEGARAALVGNENSPEARRTIVKNATQAIKAGAKGGPDALRKVKPKPAPLAVDTVKLKRRMEGDREKMERESVWSGGGNPLTSRPLAKRLTPEGVKAMRQHEARTDTLRAARKGKIPAGPGPQRRKSPMKKSAAIRRVMGAGY